MTKSNWGIFGTLRYIVAKAIHRHYFSLWTPYSNDGSTWYTRHCTFRGCSVRQEMDENGTIRTYHDKEANHES